ncbi:alanine racemase [Rhizobium sp. R72]|uniref:alanine racemase n=1 Tax=unclassified Rhizobium TaxID=2613769 RepID=UPI000B52D27C|nr:MULTISPECIES: alanine racemase [unclassified Rhizobium]OWW02349.1 alanine racemase [Rhizobium sp. R72]OWW02483.1 alanine racemase [Rhizobium sp. R711]
MQSYRPVLSVDLTAIQTNFSTVRSLVGPGVGVSAVVKSDAYGLGLERVIGPLWDAGCRSFFVATIKEALRVRRHLRQADIAIFEGLRQAGLTVYRERRLTPICNTIQEVASATLEAIPYAINLETGFGRLGLRFDELRLLIHSRLQVPKLAMSHLACADDAANARNRLQKDRFVGMCEMLAPSTPRSLVASAGVFLGADYHFERVRIGSALYGLNNTGLDPNPFQPVVRLRARLIDIRQIDCGERVGYMGTFLADRKTCLGIVAIGYRHGLAWQVANRMHAYVSGWSVPVVGRVSMEYCTIDLTDLPARLARVGSWVDFISATAPPEDMARQAATVAQEILIRTGASCARRYSVQPTGHCP